MIRCGRSIFALLRALRSRFLPRTVVLHRPPGDAPEIAKLVPFLAAQTPVDGKPSAYVCRDFTCQAPVTSVEELAAQLAVDQEK